MLSTRSLTLALGLCAPVLAAQSHTITITIPTTLTVPHDVNSLTVEGWGGGGGGSYYGGGSGGSYFRIVLPVTPGATLTLTPGIGGTGGSGYQGGPIPYTETTAGTATTMTYKSGPTEVTCTASGGQAIVVNTYTPAGTYSCNGPTPNGVPLAYTGSSGQFGDVRRVIAMVPRTTTEYTASVVGGDGGDSGHAPGTHGKGNSLLYSYSINPNGSAASTYNPTEPSGDRQQNNTTGLLQRPTAGLAPGGGGGGSTDNSITALRGGDGGAGEVHVTYDLAPYPR